MQSCRGGISYLIDQLKESHANRAKDLDNRGGLVYFEGRFIPPIEE